MMSKVLLIFFVVISWYVAGMVHSFALMLYAVCLTFFMLAMHFVTSIYKKRVSFAFASDYASAVEGRDYLVRVNINNNHGLPVRSDLILKCHMVLMEIKQNICLQRKYMEAVIRKKIL